MIRFIDLKDQICEGQTYFAFYDTVSCKFLSFNGDQVFDSLQDFTEACGDWPSSKRSLESFTSLIPDDFFARGNTNTPAQRAIEFTEKILRPVDSMLSDDYRMGFREGVEKFIEKEELKSIKKV